MIFLVGPQLKDLSVSVPMGTTYTVTNGLYDISGRHLAKFWPGFSACIGLEKFSLSIVATDKPYPDYPDIPLFHSAWDIAAGILKSVSADNVLVLSLAIEIVPTDSGDEEDALELDFIHSLPWQVLQNACRRFSCLHTFWPDITFDLREYDPSHYDQCVRYELRGFPPDSHHWYAYSDDPTRCCNPECRRYNSKAVLADRAASTN
ncbi:hypothetical protein BC629DRAFT_92807 [Irpex lacteus]|nr:hypothetical protein BC629DRAFT_92807 [Irpex lacteus]